MFKYAEPYKILTKPINFLLFALFGCHSVNAELLTMNQALEQALHANRLLENAGLEVHKAASSLAAERTKRYPQLHFDFSESYNLTPQSYTYEAGVFGAVPTEDVSIVSERGFTTVLSAGIKQPLSQLYKIGLSIDQFAVREDIAEEQVRAQRQEIVKKVRDNYYKILKTQYSLSANEQRTIFLRELNQLVDRYYQEKTVLQYQTMEVQAKLARSRHEAFRDKNDLLTQQERLNVLLGRDINKQFSVTSINDSLLPVPGLDEIESISLSMRPEVRETQLKLEYDKYGYQIKQAEYIPDIDFEVRYSRLFGTEFIPDEEAVLALKLKWDIYDWGQKSQELSKKNYAIQQSRNQIRETKARIVIEVNERYRQLQDANDMQQVSELTQAAAQEKLRVLMSQYRQQVVLLDDVLRAEADLADANNQYHQALLSAWSARAALDKAMGIE
ncbi:TolC family protein [Methyloprofundus sp.]|uniref:TolC family protein n=1 Tax=Methyloprofundus sp. TaxID=2020875 RepID=UPI003D0BA989